MNIEDRVTRLEKLVEKDLAEEALIGMYMLRLLDLIDSVPPKMWKYQSDIKTKIDIFRGALENLEREWQEHYKHHSYTDKKTNKDSNYIYSSIKEEGTDEKLHTD